MSTWKGRLKILGYALLTLALLYSLARLFLPSWFYHPVGYCAGAGSKKAIEGCKGYNVWSGILGSWLTSTPQWFVAGLVLARHHNCHHKGCWSLGHRHPKFGWPACKEHWHEMPDHIDPVKHAEEHGLTV